MNELVAFLQLQLAKARNLKDWPLVARVSETLRCVRLFDDEGCRKLCQALKEDYCKRSMYNQYLLRCRQVLLSTLSYLNRLTRISTMYLLLTKYIFLSIVCKFKSSLNENYRVLV